jgi:putative addiction module killer protein
VESAGEAGLKRTDYFDEWLNGLKDYEGKRRIEARIKNAEAGNFGEVESVGEGVCEMKFRTIGYRLYYCRRGAKDFLLLHGGGKNTKGGQTADIERAKDIKREVERSDAW